MDALHNPDVAGAAAGCFMLDGEDDLLNFSLDDGEEEKENKNPSPFLKDPYSFSPSNTLISHQDDDLSRSPSFPEFEEELEWLSNKDAFPAVETCFDLLSETPDFDGLNHQSPVSVLENSSSSSNSNGSNSSNGSAVMSCCGNLKVPSSFPVRPRSQRRRRKRRSGFGDLPSQEWQWWNHVNIKSNRQEVALPPVPVKANTSATIGRRCLHCQADQTPQWRAGPMGPKTLCNACGVRYKSGRLVPEYRPASSPTFSAALHSNSHRKIVEMRRQKQPGMGGIMANGSCGYRVG
ncbi:GATA transcription factor 1-like [Coffea arabica]|uniref:GATA transcription factor 1-like n=1 Tax=Coffea arabica TaxID=13443 RepID=A0A6P6WZP2_COFAR|nr:GATA transcription factor 1-like [Coffea arabica]